MTEKRVVLAEYFTAEDRTLLFIIRKDFDEPVVKEIPISGQQIRDFVRENFQSVSKLIESKLQSLEVLQSCHGIFSV